MEPERRLSINVAERLYRAWEGDVEDRWYHAFLMLLDETDDDNPKLVQHLHVNNADGELMLPNVRYQFSTDRTLKDYDIFPYLVGKESDILPVWNHALRAGVYLKEQEITFGQDYRHNPYARNCRAGVKSFVTAMGLTFCEEFTKSAAGVKAEGIPSLPVFAHELSAPHSLADVRRENEMLSKLIPTAIKAHEL